MGAAERLPTGIIGGGILGLAIGYVLTKRYPGLEVVVFEKEDRVATHQTGHNSGVVHAGIYYAPGSLKALLCARGRQLLREYCEERGLPFETVGKLVIAVDESELDRIDALERTATQNDVPGLRRVGRDEIREIEPHAVGLTALHSPETAITDIVAVANALAADLRAAGGRILLTTEVNQIERRAGS
jgi:L-2-hydroxyglutarate oxidase LhgO